MVRVRQDGMRVWKGGLRAYPEGRVAMVSKHAYWQREGM
jgi:hypothetical protein